MRRQRKILYLDQFAVSNMYNADPTSPWGLLRDTIIEKVNKGILLCPMPLDHLYETAGRSNKDYAGNIDEVYSKQIEDQHNFFRKVALGTAFYCYEEIAATEIIMLAKHGKVDFMRSLYLHKAYYAQIDINDIYEEVHKFNVENHQHNRDLLLGVNALREITKPLNIEIKKEEKDSTDPLFLKAITLLQVKKLIIGLKELYQKGYVEIGGVQCGSFEMPNKIDTIIYKLVKKRINRKDTEKIIRELEIHGFERIPSMNIHSILSADIALIDKQQTPNDEIDIDRAAVGLRISDYFFADNEKKLTIEKYKLDKKYRTKVYSGKKDSILALKDELSLL